VSRTVRTASADDEVAHLVEHDGRLGPSLRRRVATTAALTCVVERSHDRVDPCKGGVARPEPLQTLVVVSPKATNSPGHDFGVGVAENIDATDMVVVALREEDVSDGAGVDGIEVRSMDRCLESHAGVDHHTPVVGGEQVAVRQPG
jgi:hypothetical protein